MTEQQAIADARFYFLEQPHGCAETTCLVLQQAYGLEGAGDFAGAMVLNGGIAWRGGVCGVVSGAALAVGRLVAERIDGHREAKRVARLIMDRWIDSFEAAHGSADCRDLIGRDIHTDEGHAAFIESGIWRETCMRQIEFAIKGLFSLQDPEVWSNVIMGIENKT